MSKVYWLVKKKVERRVNGDEGHQLVLICERDGITREFVVSGVTWEACVEDGQALLPAEGGHPLQDTR